MTMRLGHGTDARELRQRHAGPPRDPACAPSARPCGPGGCEPAGDAATGALGHGGCPTRRALRRRRGPWPDGSANALEMAPWLEWNGSRPCLTRKQCGAGSRAAVVPAQRPEKRLGREQERTPEHAGVIGREALDEIASHALHQSCSPPSRCPRGSIRAGEDTGAAGECTSAGSRTDSNPQRSSAVNSPVSSSRSTSSSISCSVVSGSARRSCQARRRRSLRISST